MQTAVTSQEFVSSSASVKHFAKLLLNPYIDDSTSIAVLTSHMSSTGVKMHLSRLVCNNAKIGIRITPAISNVPRSATSKHLISSAAETVHISCEVIFITEDFISCKMALERSARSNRRVYIGYI